MMRKMILALLALSAAIVVATPAMAAFSFSFPVGTITAGPGALASGPTSFDTYYSTSGQASTGGYSGYGIGGMPLMGVPFAGPGMDCFGPCGIPALPLGGCGAAYGSEVAGQTTFATSFDTAGGGLIPNICGGSFAGQFPLFTLNMF